MHNSRKYCEEQIEIMLQRSKTKILFPIITYGLLNQYIITKKDVFTDLEIQEAYKNSVVFFQKISKA